MTFRHMLLGASAALLVAAAGCSSPNDSTPQTTVTPSSVLQVSADSVIVPAYHNLHANALALSAAVDALQSAQTDANLQQAQSAWLTMRTTWETSEGFLFGPVESLNIDPSIDTWPVAYDRIDSLLASSATISQDYISHLEDDLRGFHPIEYILFGQDGTRTAASLTPRELEYLAALTDNLQTLTGSLETSWDPSNGSSFYAAFTKPGPDNAQYTTTMDAMLEMVDAMTGICGEVGEEKLATPYNAQDAALAESPFAKTSFQDFIHNIEGAREIYWGSPDGRGNGISALVRLNNLSLDGKVEQAFASALQALQTITVPFGQAIKTQRPQIQSAMTAIAQLNDVLEDELRPYLETLK